MVTAEGNSLRPMTQTSSQISYDHGVSTKKLIGETIGDDHEHHLGRTLVGRDGLSCIACHTFTTYGSMGIPALALDSMGSRLEWDWFRRYLPDPAALRRTRVP